MTARISLAVPAHALPGSTPRSLLAAANVGIAEAATIDAPGMRYAIAHLSALRAASAVLAARAEPTRGARGRTSSVWALLVQVAPELTEWAAHFAGSADRRAAIEAGIPYRVSAEDADAMVEAARQFIAVVEVSLA
jgi:hypothetical protein